MTLLRNARNKGIKSTMASLIAMSFITGVPPAFWKNPTLRACKILYSFLAHSVKKANPKTAPG